MILGILLFVTLVGSLSVSGKKDKNNSENANNNTVVDETDEKMPDSFLGSFNDDYGVDDEVKKLIISYMDDYYRSIYTLEKSDMTVYFDNELSGSVADNAVKLLVESRKLHDYDFSLKKAHYDLTVTRYLEETDTYYVDILEDDYMNFAFLNGIESSVYDIENYFVIKKSSYDLKIHDLNKVQGYYSCFYEENETVEDVEKTYDHFYSQLKDRVSYDNDVAKVKAEKNPYIPSKTYNREYDRTAAVAYLDKYYHVRNEKWFNYSDVGGNCQNYASQALYAGGIPMDFYGEEQWKCYTDGEDPYVDESESANGRSRSWVNVGYFYDYAKENEGTGLVAEIGVNMNYAQPGDIIVVGNSSLAHTVMVSKVVDGHILVNSNSIDMKDFPVDAYTYTNLVLIKILGFNQYQ